MLYQRLYVFASRIFFGFDSKKNDLEDIIGSLDMEQIRDSISYIEWKKAIWSDLTGSRIGVIGSIGHGCLMQYGDFQVFVSMFYFRNSSFVLA